MKIGFTVRRWPSAKGGWLWGVAAVWWLVGCQGLGGKSGVAPWSSANIRGEAGRYQALVEVLAGPAMEGRGAGTAGLDRARGYLVEQFRQIGLEPGVVQAAMSDRDPHGGSPIVALDGQGKSSEAKSPGAGVLPGGVGYWDRFEVPLTAVAAGQELAVLDHEGRLVEEAVGGEDFNALGMSPSGGFVGSAVFAGYGIVEEDRGYDSYRRRTDADGPSVEGKVVIVFRYEPQSREGRSLWVGGGESSGSKSSGGHGSGTGSWSAASRLVSKANWAAQRGAVALLVVNPPMQDVGGLKTTASTGSGAGAPIPVVHVTTGWFSRILEQCGYDPAEVMTAFQAGADRGEDRPTALKQVVIRGRVEIERPKAAVANVVAVCPGWGRLGGEVVVVGAHYDHLGYGEIGSLSPDQHAIHPGADDNASGTAGLVTLARWLAQRDASKRESSGMDKNVHVNSDSEALGYRRGGSKAVGPRATIGGTATDSEVASGDISGDASGGGRTVVFVAFTAEERGLLGSAHFMKHLERLGIEKRQIKAMVNMDMIGRMEGDRLYVMGTETGDRWRSLIDAANRDIGLDLRYSEGAIGGSDHVIFQVNEIPAVHFFTGVHGDYHRPSDTADKINAAGAVRALGLIYGVLNGGVHGGGVLDGLIRDPQPIAFVPDSVGKGLMGGIGDPHGDSGPRPRLGILPDYASLEGDQGCSILGVIPGSGAAEAGLLPGDAIVGWNKTPIRNVKDLTAALGASRPGDRVEIRVRRRGKEVTLTATLGQR